MKRKHPVLPVLKEPPTQPLAPADAETDPTTKPPAIPPDTEPTENG